MDYSTGFRESSLLNMMDRKACILIIDDSPCIRQSLKFILRDDFHVLTAPGALEGHFHLSVASVDIILLDIRMRGTDGLQFLAQVKKQYPYIGIIMITAYASLKTTQMAIRYGAYDYLIKPFDKDELRSVIERALAERQTMLAAKNEIARLRESTSYMEGLLRSAKDTILSSNENIMTAMLRNIHSRDNYTWSHVWRVRDVSLSIAQILGLADDQILWLTYSALLHDIGKVNIDGDILQKAGVLTDYEYSIIKTHPEKGAEIISTLPFLQNTIPVITSHHERFDGSGYPKGLRADDIPFCARILAVADAIDSMMYSPARERPGTAESIRKELLLHAGTQFDPAIVNALIREKLPPLA